MAFQSLPTRRLPAPLGAALERLLRIDQLESLYQRAQGRDFVEALLNELQVRIAVAPGDLEKIPPAGPVVAVANHPSGILDGVLLIDLLSRVRKDIRVLTNQLLGDLPELTNVCIFLDPFDRPGSRVANARALREAIAHLREGGLLAIFPAGEVSHFDFRRPGVCDPEWNTTAARLIRLTRAKAIPVFISGANGLAFQVLGMMHPRLRTAALPSQLLNKRGKSIEIRIGVAIDASRIDAIPEDAESTRFLRLRTDLLGRRPLVAVMAPRRNPAPIAAPQSPAAVTREIESLPSDCLLEQTRDFSVCLAAASRIPLVLQEIGRLRETAFRAAGEGTGSPADLDRFDANYMHLFLWHRGKAEIVGAYRIGDVPALLRSGGRKALYTTSLFRYRAGFLESLGPALELGRSFVRPEFQRQFAPLLLLWKGIGAWVARHPEYSTLIGAVSVSNQYSRASRELIARYFQKRLATDLRGSVSARRPLRLSPIRGREIGALCSLLPDVDDLSAPIADLEPDGKGIPILVKQYVKLGGKLMAFSVDPQFGNTLDGFVMVDLTRTKAETLERYMGREKAESFLRWHASPQPRVA